MKKIKHFIKAHRIISSILALIILIVIIMSIVNGTKDHSGEVITLEPQSFTREVAIAGKVIPAQDVELAFETSGRIVTVNYKEGDRVGAGALIASLSSDDIRADLLKAQADLEAEKVKLDGYRSADSSVTEVYTAKRALVESLQDAYTTADDAIHNKVDQFYENPRSRNPQIEFAFNGYALRQELNKGRYEIEDLLESWEEVNKKLSVDTYSATDVTVVKDNIMKVKVFLDRVSVAVNSFDDEGSLTQAEIDKSKSDLSTARTQINTSISHITTAQEKLRGVESQIPYQEAKVKAAQAVVDNYNAQLGKTMIYAPFTGIISKQGAKVGAIVGANTGLMTLISSRNYQVEAYIPEVHIKDVKVGNSAVITLDAFGKETPFQARVIAIDPAETIRDGVSTYKVTFVFDTNDERLKSGMTANAIIATETRTDVLLVPSSALYTRGGESYVQVKVGKEVIEKYVRTGEVAATGDIEVYSGVSEGEKVVINPQVK